MSGRKNVRGKPRDGGDRTEDDKYGRTVRAPGEKESGRETSRHGDRDVVREIVVLFDRGVLSSARRFSGPRKQKQRPSFFFPTKLILFIYIRARQQFRTPYTARRAQRNITENIRYATMRNGRRVFLLTISGYNRNIADGVANMLNARRLVRRHDV